METTLQCNPERIITAKRLHMRSSQTFCPCPNAEMNASMISAK